MLAVIVAHRKRDRRWIRACNGGAVGEGKTTQGKCGAFTAARNLEAPLKIRDEGTEANILYTISLGLGTHPRPFTEPKGNNF